MNKILDCYRRKDGLYFNFEISGIEISTVTQETGEPNDIIEKAFNSVLKLVKDECERKDIPFDETIPTMEDKIMELRLLGLNNLTFIEGQSDIEFSIRCVADTLFGISTNVTNQAKITCSCGVLDNGILTVSPKESTSVDLIAEYNNLVCNTSCYITYKTLEQVKEENRQAEEQEKLRKEKELADAKIMKINELDTACNNDILSGFVCNIKGEDREFGFNINDQMNLTGKLTMLNANPNIGTVIWKCNGLEGQLDSYTRAEFNQICLSADETKTLKIGKFWQKKNLVLNATTKEEIDEIIW